MEAENNFVLKLAGNMNINTALILEWLKNRRHRRKLVQKYTQSLHKMRAYNKQYLMLAQAAIFSPVQRSLWQKPRTKSFWEVDCGTGDEFFKNSFRMGRQTFEILCDLLKGLEKENTVMRDAIPLRKSVAVALYTLGSSAEYRSISNMFGIGNSTVAEILIEFCKEAWKILRPLYMNSFPLTAEKIQENVNGFERIGLPQCFGAIDGCHVEIHPKAEDAVDYYNYKGWYLTILLALVDYRYRFTYISVGSPGRCNDSQTYEKSFLKKELMNCRLLKEMSSNCTQT